MSTSPLDLPSLSDLLWRHNPFVRADDTMSTTMLRMCSALRLPISSFPLRRPPRTLKRDAGPCRTPVPPLGPSAVHGVPVAGSVSPWPDRASAAILTNSTAGCRRRLPSARYRDNP